KTSEKILSEILKNTYVTISELADLTGVTTRSVERNLKKLQDSGVLRRIGPAKGGHWEVIE
ncbi:MAG TPA: winged helix-turn-helix transcriptional regulator, partial [Gammaproteobacteria bacterium]|nr:winged helix-turn-helix transcriptional regulator [Gammaproteobacteria bacterium]